MPYNQLDFLFCGYSEIRESLHLWKQQKIKYLMLTSFCIPSFLSLSLSSTNLLVAVNFPCDKLVRLCYLVKHLLRCSRLSEKPSILFIKTKTRSFHCIAFIWSPITWKRWECCRKCQVSKITFYGKSIYVNIKQSNM